MRRRVEYEKPDKENNGAGGLDVPFIYAADDVKIKLTDTGGNSKFAIQDSTPTTVFQVDSDGNANLLFNSELRLYNAGNTFYTGFTAPVLGGNLMLTLPTGSGSDGYVLKTNGAGVLSWVDKENPLSFNLPLSRTAAFSAPGIFPGSTITWFRSNPD